MENQYSNTGIFERSAIMDVQKYLRQLSYHDNEINPVPIDGIWESQTRRALTAFQNQNGLEPTGRVDRTTWELLKQKYDESVALNSPPAQISLFPRNPSGYSVKLGDRGFLVDTIQYILSELERLYFFPDYIPSGIYDDKTVELIKSFQAFNNIDATGEVNRETWDALAIQHNLLSRVYQG